MPNVEDETVESEMERGLDKVAEAEETTVVNAQQEDLVLSAFENWALEEVVQLGEIFLIFLVKEQLLWLMPIMHSPLKWLV